MARVRQTAKVIEDEGSPSNCKDRAASSEVVEAVATSSSLSSSSESGKISSLDGSVSSRESCSSSSTSSSDENSDSNSGGDVETMLSNRDAKKIDADVEEDEVAEGSGAAAIEESGETLAGVNGVLEDLVKPSTCFMGRSL